MGRPRPSRTAPQAEGLGWAGGLRREAGPGLPLALPLEIQPSVETLGIQQACSEGVGRGSLLRGCGPSDSQPPRVGIKACVSYPTFLHLRLRHLHPALWEPGGTGRLVPG